MPNTDSTVTPEVTPYTGFTSPQVQTKKVDGAEMTVIQYHYTRNVHRLTFVLEMEKQIRFPMLVIRVQ